jgi:hypothetical protein
MMEGVGSEAASLAGHLALDNLCWIYVNNHITIEGSTRITFTEDIAARFLGYGWNVLRVGDANDIDRIEHALDIFRKNKGRPQFPPSPSARHDRRARRMHARGGRAESPQARQADGLLAAGAVGGLCVIGIW